jgi:putative phosphoesterase
MTRIGILSDTHLTQVTPLFRKQVASCFAGADMILHAGDLTELGILKVFKDRQVHAVHGNMCGNAAYTSLPAEITIRIGDFVIGLCHGAGGSTHDIEERLWQKFGPVDCIVYGHTHNAVCNRAGPVLFINPGSFLSRSRHGMAGTYAILEVGPDLRGSIHQVDGDV